MRGNLNGRDHGQDSYEFSCLHDLQGCTRRDRHSDIARCSLERFDSTAVVVAITQAIFPQNSKRVEKQEATGCHAFENGKDTALIRAAWVSEL
jgi:hypothetical protein